MQVAQLTYDELLKQGRQAEDERNNADAITNYQKAIQIEPINKFAYNRLMIIYRKEKMYKEELKLIDEAITNIQTAYNKKKTKFKSNSNVFKLSNALMKSTGLTDKKGDLVYEPEPVPTWKKRRQTVLKRLGKKS